MHLSVADAFTCLSKDRRRIDRLVRRLGRRSRPITFTARAGSFTASPRDLAHSRLVELVDAAEAETFRIAYYRYAELHRRVVGDPASGCALTAVVGLSPRRPLRLAIFWSRRAAREFDRFWTCYRRVYGPKAADTLATVH